MGRNYLIFWQGWQDLNLRMPESKSGALTTWLHPYIRSFLCGKYDCFVCLDRKERSDGIAIVTVLRSIASPVLSPQIPAQKSKRKSVFIFGAGDGNRTHDLKDHNLAL